MKKKDIMNIQFFKSSNISIIKNTVQFINNLDKRIILIGSAILVGIVIFSSYFFSSPKKITKIEEKAEKTAPSVSKVFNHTFPTTHSSVISENKCLKMKKELFGHGAVHGIAIDKDFDSQFKEIKNVETFISEKDKNDFVIFFRQIWDHLKVVFSMIEDISRGDLYEEETDFADSYNYKGLFSEEDGSGIGRRSFKSLNEKRSYEMGRFEEKKLMMGEKRDYKKPTQIGLFKNEWISRGYCHWESTNYFGEFEYNKELKTLYILKGIACGKADEEKKFIGTIIHQKTKIYEKNSLIACIA